MEKQKAPQHLTRFYLKVKDFIVLSYEGDYRSNKTLIQIMVILAVVTVFFVIYKG